ncbi:hypothetical protein EYF80_000586 [Liparis tanakae]|uniref:Uncharacterized protein n=1 Tax=Liparis tanakae TaxID=230148 RepID=A0A4Z2JI46_9TELE|nr:hypothetical protein EYF80_000586 [Liparis tanakae]
MAMSTGTDIPLCQSGGTAAAHVTRLTEADGITAITELHTVPANRHLQTHCLSRETHVEDGKRVETTQFTNI